MLIVPRLRFGTKESEQSAVNKMVPNGFNGSDFQTLRWRWYRKFAGALTDGRGKSIVDLSRVQSASIFDNPRMTVNPHYAIKPLCMAKHEKSKNVMYRHAPFVAYHYLGTFEQWSYRKDARATVRLNRTEHAIFQQLAEGENDSMRPWLNNFVSKEGDEIAHALLEGAGKL
jgi:hypothetical protein